jgi:hypothetical protein
VICLPLQRTRELSVRRKLNAMPAVFAGKSVLLVDDSIVRGTTMSQIAGAKKVGVASFSAYFMSAQFSQLQVQVSHNISQIVNMVQRSGAKKVGTFSAGSAEFSAHVLQLRCFASLRHVALYVLLSWEACAGYANVQRVYHLHS